jgi:DNA-binding NtrC family response regulator
LANYFLATYAEEFQIEAPGIHKKAMRCLEQHDWPGNVRQLENVIRKALVDCRGMTISEDLIEASLRRSVVKTRSTQVGMDESGTDAGISQFIHSRLLAASRGELENVFDGIFEDIERELYRQAVELSHGHQTNIAKWLGVSRLTVREKLDKYELFPKRQAGGQTE